MASIVALPYQYMPDPGLSRAIANGQIYVGIAGTLPADIPANQKQLAARQEDGSEAPIAQPVDTSAGGVPIDNTGALVQLLVDGSYSILVNDSLGAQKYYSANVTDGAPLTEGTGISAVPFLADLIALDPTSAKQASVSGRTVAGDGYEDDFVFVLGDQSGNVATDPRQGVWVAAGSDPTGASGAWTRAGDHRILERYFKISTDPDYKNAIDAAVAYVAAKGGGDVELTGGGTRASTGNIINSEQIRIGSYDGTILELSGNGTLLSFVGAPGLALFGCGIFGNLKLRHENDDWLTGTDTTSIALFLQNTYQFIYDLVDIRDFYRAIDMVGVDKGCVYGSFTIRQLVTNRYNVRTDATGTGWCNENKFWGGNWSTVLQPGVDTEHLTLNQADGMQVIAGSFEGRPTRIATIGTLVTNSCFFGCRFEVLAGGSEMFDSTGTNMSFYGCQFNQGDVDIIIRSGAGQHFFSSGSSFDILDENVPSVAVGIAAGPAGTRVQMPLNPINEVPDGSAEHMVQPPLVSGNNIGVLPATWTWTYSAFNTGAVASAETVDIKDMATSLKIVNTDVNGLIIGCEIKGLTVGSQYTISFMIKCTVIATSAIRVRVGSSISAVEDLNRTITPDGTWITFTTVFTAGATSRFISILFNTAVAYTCFLDGICCHRGTQTPFGHTDKQMTESGGDVLGDLEMLDAGRLILTDTVTGTRYYLSVASGVLGVTAV